MTRVLVVEDSPTQAQQLAFILEDAGFAVDTAPDADDAIARLGQGGFDVVLSDLLLPGDSGFDLCRRIKADARYGNLPVVVLTSQADPANVLRGLEAGADGFMTKGRPPEAILACVRRVLARNKGQVSNDGQASPPIIFHHQAYDISAGREQLLDVLVSAFEEVVDLNQLNQESAEALRQLNGKLQGANGQLEERNQQLQRLADELAESIKSERKAHEDLKRAESQLVQAEKLSSLGQMVAGIAHEINNPLSFVTNNLAVLRRDLGGVREIVGLYEEGESVLATHQPELRARIQELAERIDLAYTLENLDSLAVRSRDGLKRIQQIVLSLRDFARLDEGDLHAVDVNAGVTSTVAVVQTKAEERQVTLEVNLAPLPQVTCYPGKINQVLLNLLTNAIDACPPGGRVTVSTCASAEGVELHVADTGCGIDPAIREKIFDPFFTTKPPGHGTGLGLSITYGIVQAHGGKIDFESVPGQGSHFVVRLRLEPPGARG